jgi:TolB-like protein/DNA-binding winged helix-turn-helix (wHTH) protein/Tfp pilus assembly protein PilF
LTLSLLPVTLDAILKEGIMRATLSAPRRLSFGAFEADLRSGELLKYGNRVRLQAQPFQLLVMLLEHPGELVTREEICSRLWTAETFVDFDRSLGTALNKIREVLNDSAAEPRFVETLPRRGYRFIAAVSVVKSDPEPQSPAEDLAKAPNRSRFFNYAVGISVLLLSVSIGAVSSRWWLPKLSGPPPIRSIAVLPLLNLSNDPEQQFFAEGMTDELITDLAQISSLRVTSRTSVMTYLGTRKPAAQIARELGVDALVEGSVLRSGSQVRITAQLINAASDRHLWARSYNRDLSDVLTVQSEVAREIAQNISIELTPQEKLQLSRPHPVNPEVALLCFKGSYYLSKLDASRAKESFTEAIQLDPGSAESWAGLADALHTMGVSGDYDAFSQARDAANKALQIDGAQAQALMVLGAVSFLHDWNPTQSEIFFRRSIDARPGYSMAHALFANTLAHHGKFEEAIQQIKLASALDPVSVGTNSMAWHVYFSARRYDDALRVILSTIEVDPEFAPAYWRLGVSWEQKGEYQKAIAALHGEDAKLEASQLRDALASRGARGYWERKLETLLRQRTPEDRYGFSEIARCYMRIGKREEAIASLEKGYEMHDPYLIFWLPVYEEFDPLRSDPRFQRMLHGLGIS